MPHVARKGQTTSNGGTVLKGSPSVFAHGTGVATVGCPVADPRLGPSSITSGHPRVLVDGQWLACAGHHTAPGAGAAGAGVPPVVSMSDDWELVLETHDRFDGQNREESLKKKKFARPNAHLRLKQRPDGSWVGSTGAEAGSFELGSLPTTDKPGFGLRGGGRFYFADLTGGSNAGGTFGEASAGMVQGDVAAALATRDSIAGIRLEGEMVTAKAHGTNFIGVNPKDPNQFGLGFRAGAIASAVKGKLHLFGEAPIIRAVTPFAAAPAELLRALHLDALRAGGDLAVAASGASAGAKSGVVLVYDKSTGRVMLLVEGGAAKGVGLSGDLLIWIGFVSPPPPPPKPGPATLLDRIVNVMVGK